MGYQSIFSGGGANPAVPTYDPTKSTLPGGSYTSIFTPKAHIVASRGALTSASNQERNQLSNQLQNPYGDVIGTKQNPQLQALDNAVQKNTTGGFLKNIGIAGAKGVAGAGVQAVNKVIAQPIVNTAKIVPNAASLASAKITGNKKAATNAANAFTNSATGSLIGPAAQLAVAEGTNLAANKMFANKNLTDQQKQSFLKTVLNPSYNKAGLDLTASPGKTALSEAELAGGALALPILTKGGMEALKGRAGAVEATAEATKEAPSPPVAKSPEKVSTPVASEVKPEGQGTKPTPVTTEVTATKAPKPAPNESGFVNPGAPVADAKALIQKHQDSVKFTGDINRFQASSEGAKGNLLNDAAKLTKNRTPLSATEKNQLQDLRDARATGQETPKVSANVLKADKESTDFAKATIANDVERAKLEGNLEKAKTLAQRDPESYTHRVAQNKGGAFDYVLQGDRKNPLSVGMGKTTPADKTRTMFSAIDENGNRKVISVKSQTGKNALGQKVTKSNQITAFENGKPTATLGSLPRKADIVGKTFEGKDGHTYKIDNATASEIEKNTGVKYYKDPYLTNQASYLDSRIALENARMFEAIKNSPLSEKFMSAPGETAPKGWRPAEGLDQFRGYRFDPKVADTLHDLFARNKGNNSQLFSKVSNFLRQIIVYFPIKHDFNILSAYAIDRGMSGLVRPIPAIKSIYLATQDVAHNSDFYQELANKGFQLTTNDKQAFEKVFNKELSKLTDDKPQMAQIAKAMGTSPARLYTAIQRMSVWDVQDIANIARVRERMAPKMFGLKKGMSMEDAIKQTQRFGFQYKVPARVAGTRAGSELLQSRAVFFGRYRYDQYKIIGNIMKDALKVNKPSQAAQAYDKMAALLVGGLVAWPLVDKGIQKVTGDVNAYIKAPGPMELPELAQKLIRGKESPNQGAANQIYLSSGLTIPLDVLQNNDPFTGKQIVDPNTSKEQQGKALTKWLYTQFAPGQKFTATKNATDNKVVSTILSIAGTSLPKNSPFTNKLNSLKYDTLPTVQKNAKATVLKTGNTSQATPIINEYNQSVLKAAKQDLKTKGLPVPSDQDLITQLKKAGIYYQPKPATIQSWTQPTKKVEGAFQP